MYITCPVQVKAHHLYYGLGLVSDIKEVLSDIPLYYWSDDCQDESIFPYYFGM